MTTTSIEHLSDNVLHLIGQYIYYSEQFKTTHTSPLYYYFVMISSLNRNMLMRAYNPYFWQDQAFSIVLRNKQLFSKLEDMSSEEAAEENNEEELSNEGSTIRQVEALMDVCQFTWLNVKSYHYRKFTTDLLVKIPENLGSVLRHLELNCILVNRGELIACLAKLTQLHTFVFTVHVMNEVEKRRNDPVVLPRTNWKRFEVHCKQYEETNILSEFITCCVEANPHLTTLVLATQCPFRVSEMIPGLAKLEKLVLEQVTASNDLYNQVFIRCKRLKSLSLYFPSHHAISVPFPEKLEELSLRNQLLNCPIQPLPNLTRLTMTYSPLNIALSFMAPGKITHLHISAEQLPLQGVQQLVELCPNLVSLTHAEKLSWSPTYDGLFLDLQSLELVVTQCTKLKTLSISHPDMTAALQTLAKNAPESLTEVILVTSILSRHSSSPIRALPQIRTLKWASGSVDGSLFDYFPNLKRLELNTNGYWPMLIESGHSIRDVISNGFGFHRRHDFASFSGKLPNLHTIEFGKCNDIWYGFDKLLTLGFFLMVATPNLYECNIIQHIRKKNRELYKYLDRLYLKLCSREETEHGLDKFFRFLVEEHLTLLPNYDGTDVRLVTEELISHKCSKVRADVNAITLILPGLYDLVEPMYPTICEDQDIDCTWGDEEN